MKKVAIVISDVTRPVAFEWLASSVLSKEFLLEFHLLNSKSTPASENLKSLGVSVFEWNNQGWTSLPKLIFQLFLHLRKNKVDVIHTHLLFANLSGLVAGFLAGVPLRIHTRHHSDPYHFKHRHAIFYDRVSQALSHRIVASCNNVKEILVDLEGVSSEKIFLIPFGIKLTDFDSVTETEKLALRKKYNIPDGYYIVGMVSRYIEIKGLQYAIPAFKEFNLRYPNSVLLIANAVGGNYSHEVRKHLSELPANSYREIPFESDMPTFYSICDQFWHLPIGRRVESFGQSYTEPLAARTPCIFTLSGVAPEFIIDEKNALVCGYCNVNEVVEKSVRLKNDLQLVKAITENGRLSIETRFSFENFLQNHRLLWNQTK